MCGYSRRFTALRTISEDALAIAENTNWELKWDRCRAKAGACSAVPTVGLTRLRRRRQRLLALRGCVRTDRCRSRCASKPMP